jgi:hypothetical protein
VFHFHDLFYQGQEYDVKYGKCIYDLIKNMSWGKGKVVPVLF